jgi:hypothetical protein
VRTGVFPGRARPSGAKGCVLSDLVSKQCKQSEAVQWRRRAPGSEPQIDRVSAGQGRRDVRQRQADGRPTKQYKQGNHADGSNARHDPIDPFCASASVSTAAAVAELASGHPLSYSPLRELAADDIRDRRKYPLTDQDLPAELSTSAVTVKVAKRSASGPDTAGASGPGLAPPPGAARSIRFAQAAHRPRVPPQRAAANHQGLVERAGPDRAGTAIPAACPNHVQIDSYHLHTAGRPTPRQ